MLLILIPACLLPNKKRPNWANKLENGRQSIHDRLVSLSQDVDKFFGDERIEEEYMDLRMALANRLVWHDGDGLDGSVRVRGTFPLPVLEHKLALVYGSDTDIDDIESVDRAKSKDREVESGLRYLSGDGPWTFKANVGARWSGGPQVYLRPGVRYQLERETWDLRISQYLEWHSEEGFGTINSIEFDHALGRNVYFRNRSDLAYSEISDGVEISESLILRYRPNEIWALSLEYHVDFETHPAMVHNKSGTGVRFRSLLLFPWLEHEITPFVTFERSRNYSFDPGIVYSLKAWFERSDH